MKLSFYFLIIFAFVSCKDETKNQEIPEFPNSNKTEQVQLKYAEGFSVNDNGNYKVLTITNPWPEAEKSYRYVLISRENMAKTTFLKDAYDGIIINPVERIVVTSTTHIPALELLNVTNKLVGFPGTDYVSSQNTRQHIDNGTIRELGKNEGINTEVLLEVNPDVVVGFGVDGVNKTFETIKKANIPVIYNGDWVESSALAKAEWIKFFGVLFNKEKEADSIFNQIEADYLEAKSIAQNAKNRPTVLSGAMQGDIWYLPYGSSPESQFMKDAGVNYLWSETSGNGSLNLSFESVFKKAKDADLWISPSYYSSYDQLEKANSLYNNFKAFKNRNIYTFSNTTGETGGVLYYELGTARPDLVLKDLIKIAHPELLKNYKPYFFNELK
ncbi:ABC transporter substrate-binding protein [Winogradskyella ursingii]|uniref:ABC transporter substrate-binding protein n=1 Tax=Winogradskyella ursingii TaxID=2686079 RepID=UPI0015CAC6A0|nr:ABC transporter substrate-binding protein [Winogradskyella ursingii]